MTFYKLLHGCCSEMLNKIPARTIDAIVTDPPYNINLEPQRELHNGETITNDALTEKEFVAFYEKIVWHFWRLLKQSGAGYLFCDWSSYPLFYNLLKRRFLIKNCIVWDKLHFGIGYNYRPQHELIIFFMQKDSTHKIKSNNIANVLPVKDVANELHITQKPTKLLEILISESTNKEGIVLDPFCGSGSTMEACQNLGRSCYGIEIEETYIKTIKKRCFGKQFLNDKVSYELLTPEMCL